LKFETQINSDNTDNHSFIWLLFAAHLQYLHKTDRILSRSKVISFSRLWLCIHGMLSHSYLEHRKGLSRRFKQHKTTRVYNGKNIIKVSQSVGDNIRQQLGIRPESLEVINNPFDVANILQQASEPCELEGSEYLIHVGRFHISKRHDRLLRAYALSAIPAKLLLLGYGAPKKVEEIKQLAEKLDISERVILAGFQANPFQFIKNAVMLVLSSDNEGFGNVLVEVLLCGTPGVSTRCPGEQSRLCKKEEWNKHCLK
jgi:glycosyltransferase involved in cell wall biosynthesis